MSKKNKRKDYDKYLQKLIDKKDFVKIKMTFFGDDEDQSGFILAMSEHFLLIQNAKEFTLDGYTIITKYDFESIRCNEYDNVQKKILTGEGKLKDYGIKNPINLESWSTIIKNLKNLDFHVIIKNVRKKYLEFNIGPIVKLTNKKVKINNYDPTGKLDEKPTSIAFEDIRIIQFGDKYSTIFRKYLK